MQELEKILEEIVEEQRSYEADHAWNYARGLEQAADIIRKHISRENDPETTRSSRDTEAGWIPVEEQLPTAEEQKKDGGDFEITIWNEYKQGKPFVSRGYFNGSEFELQNKDYSTFAEVIAWRPLPEPYRPERSVGE